MRFLNRSKRARERAGLSIGKAAELLNIPVADLEQAEIPSSDLGKLTSNMADVYMVKVEWLTGESELRDYVFVKTMKGIEDVSPRDRDVIAEFAASLPQRKPMPIDKLLEEFGHPDGPMPVAPLWHVESESHSCPHGWVIGGDEWGICDCEDPANPWPPREPGDGPRDCPCFGCMDHKPRWERGKLNGCEYKDHHCADCHENKRCTLPECA